MKASKHVIGYAEASALLSYEPETGRLYWREREGNKKFNRRFAGSEAGALSGSYIIVNISGFRCLAHRLIWLLETGDWPDRDIDHINGVKNDNRFFNLRLVSHQDNCRNMPLKRNNTSGYFGVYYQRRIDRWTAQIADGGKMRTLGVFRTKDEAVSARKSAEARLGYHPNHGRPAA